MQPGCSSSQGGDYPAFQHLSNVDALRSHQYNHGTPAPVAHPENVLKFTMVAHQDPPPRRQNDAQLQHLQRPQHHVPSCEVEQPKPAASMWTPSAGIYSPLNTTTQCSSANENSAVHLNNNGQQRGRFPRGSNINFNNALQQRHSVGTTTVALKDDIVGVTAQQHQYSQKIQPHQLSEALKTGNLLSSTLTKVNIEPSARTNLTNERQCQSQKVKCSLGILNCENTVVGTHSPGYPSEHQQVVTSSTAVQQRLPPTDEEIHKLIAKELDYKGNLSNTFASDKVKQHKGSVGQHTSATGHTPPANCSEDHRANADITWSCDYSRVTAAAHSTENPQIMMEVAATWTTNEDSPGVLTSASGMPMIDLTKMAPNSTHDAHNVLDVSWAPKPTVTIGYDNIQFTKPSSAMSRNYMSLDRIQDIAKKRKNTDGHCPIADQEVVAHSEAKSSIDQIQILNVMSMFGDQGKRLWELSSHEKSDRVQEPPLSLESNRVAEQTTNFIKCSNYEDVSDDEVMPPNAEHESLDILVCNEKVTYEDISDEGSVQRKEGNMNVWGEHCSCPCFVETDGGFEQVHCPKCDAERQSVSCSSGNVSDGDETDDEMDDYIVIPVSVADLKYELGEENQDFPDKTGPDDSQKEDEEFQGTTALEHCEAQCPAPETVPASVSYQIEVFDTVASFLQSKRTMVGFPSDGSKPEHETHSDTGEPQTPRHTRVSHSEHEDSSETEDSCDYSSESEHNYLTASRHVFKKRSAPPKDWSAVEKENKPNKTTSQNEHSDKLGCMQKLKELIKSNASTKRTKSRTSRQNSKAQGKLVDSDSEDESDYNCRAKTKLKRPSFSSSVDSQDVPSSQQMGRPHQTADSRSPQSGSDLHQTRFEEVIKCASSSGHFTDTNEADPKHVSHAANRKEFSNYSIIIIDSDTEDSANTEDESDKKPKKESKAFPISSGLNNGNEQKRHPCENVSRSEPAQETFGRMAMLPVGSSEINDALFNKGMQKDCSYSALSIKKSGHLLETEDGNEHIQDKTSKTTLSGSGNCIIKKATTERLLTSVAKDYSHASCSVQNDVGLAENVDGLSGLGEEKARICVQSSRKSPVRQQSVAQESSSSHNCLIPRLYVIEPADPRDRLKLVKTPVVHKRNKENTVIPVAPTVASKETHTTDKNTQPLSLNKTQANMTKPKQLSIRSSSDKEGQSTTGLSQPGEIAPKPDQSKTKEKTSVPKHNLTSSKLRHSFSYPSTSHHPLTNTRDQSFTAATQLSALERLKKDWSKSYYPTRKDRKTINGTEEALNTEAKREAHQPHGHHDRAPRQRRNSKESETSLMKRAKMEAVQLTKATNRNNSREQRGSVGDGYKWSERPTVARSKKGFIERGEHGWSPSSSY